jgi:uncharacterized protein YcgI (DUF1989 family)
MAALGHDVVGRKLVDEVIPARTARAYTMTRGTVMRVIDSEGQQAADVVAYNLHELEEALSTEITTVALRTTSPSTGKILYSTEWRPMFTIVGDTVGTNYLPGAICSDEANVFRYGVRGTLNCRDNLAAALAPWGVTKRQVQGALGAFLNLTYWPDGRTDILEPISKPGDYVELRAEMDLLVGVSACPQVNNICNAWNPTPLGVVVYEPST